VAENQMALSDRTIRNAKPRDSVYRIRDVSGDPELKGFGITVAPAGSKTFFLGYSSPTRGSRRQLNLGRYPATSLKDARQKARAARAAIALGNDPADEHGDTQSITLGEGLDLYARAKLDHQRTGRTTERDLRRDFASLLNLSAVTIVSPMVAKVIDEKSHTAPIMANRLHGYARPWFLWLAARGHIKGNPMDGIEKPVKERARERVLADQEASAIWIAADALGYPFGPLVRLLMLTGVRRQELSGMRQDEIDLGHRLWTVPAERSKTGAAIRIPLSEAAVAVLETIPVTDGPFLFTTTGTTAVSGFSRMKGKLDRVSGVDDWRLHDFRRTMVTAMVDLGIDATTADRCLNHTGAATMSTVQRVYQRSDLLDQRRHAMEAWALRLAGMVTGINPTGNVVRMKK
jgi:integrase